MIKTRLEQYEKTVLAEKFYNSRYAKGYVEEWPSDKKIRVHEIIKNLNLPSEGIALDFGCGNGVFTKILKQALPHWEIYGYDISKIAIQNASKKNPECIFFVNDNVVQKNKKFDFIFSHHVLEHVLNIEDTVQQIIDKAKNNSSILHILPCGNRDSFEWQICQLNTNGINKKRGNTFFFEDKGHVRRMTTDSCVLLFENFGFTLKQSFYSNQYYGTINWITRSHPILILTIFNPFRGKNLEAKLKLTLLLLKFILIFALRLPYVVYQNFDNILLRGILFIPSYTVSIFIDKYIIYKSNQEWQKFKPKSNGSEMYLHFIK